MKIDYTVRQTKDRKNTWRWTYRLVQQAYKAACLIILKF